MPPVAYPATPPRPSSSCFRFSAWPPPPTFSYFRSSTCFAEGPVVGRGVSGRDTYPPPSIRAFCTLAHCVRDAFSWPTLRSSFHRDAARLALLASTLFGDLLCRRWHHHGLLQVPGRVAPGAVVHQKSVGAPPFFPRSLVGRHTSVASAPLELSHLNAAVSKRRTAEFVGHLEQFVVLSLLCLLSS